jgi:multidrug efflux system membrane fusion protein
MDRYFHAQGFAKALVYPNRIVAVTLLIIVGGLTTGCTKQQAQEQTQQQPQGQPPGKQPGGRRGGGGGPAVPVMVDKVTLKTIPVEVSAIGNVEAYSTVSVKAQVAGALLEANFKEGDFVKKGQLLFKIDEEPYQTELERAQAALARDKAVAANNRIQAERYKKLLEEGIVPRQQVESMVSSADSADAVVATDDAAVKAAKLNLRYCTINAPIDGHTGSLMVQPGNLVKASDVPLVVINQINPIYVDFAVPQNYLTDIKRYMNQGKLSVAAEIPNDSGLPEQGVLVFVDNAVDPSTATIRLKATFQNSRDRLWPGLFVNVVLRLSEQRNSTVVSSQAVTTTPDGQSVYVVKADGTVESRRVVSKRTIAGAAVIDQGLQEGETVVIDGQLRLVPGAKVDIKNKKGESGTVPAGKSGD